MNTRYIIAGVVTAFLLFGGAWWYTSQSALYPFELSESVTSWDFEGAYTGNPELEDRAHAEIERLNGMFGTEDNTDYILYVSIAGQYELLGDGAKEYEYLLRALAEDSGKTGLAWNNLGVLLTRLGAYDSARVAYEKAAAAQPTYEQYQTSLLLFLTQYFPEDEEGIQNAYRKAGEALNGEWPTIIEIRARWLEKVGRIEEAIEGWKLLLEASPQSAAAVKLELQRLENEL